MIHLTDFYHRLNGWSLGNRRNGFTSWRQSLATPYLCSKKESDAGGWRDQVSLAGSSGSVWRDICLTNQPNISNALGELIAELQSLKDALDARDFNQAREFFAAANRAVAEHRALHYRGFEKL